MREVEVGTLDEAIGADALLASGVRLPVGHKLEAACAPGRRIGNRHQASQPRFRAAAGPQLTTPGAARGTPGCSVEGGRAQNEHGSASRPGKHARMPLYTSSAPLKKGVTVRDLRP